MNATAELLVGRPAVSTPESAFGRRTLLFKRLTEQLDTDEFWSEYLRNKVSCERPSQNLHVAIFVQPFLQWILDGTKTVESRFSKNEVVPFQQVVAGDVVIMKEAGGPIRGVALADGAWFYRLDPSTLGFIKERFSDVIGAVDEEFWTDRQDARYATLISLSNVRQLAPIPYEKSDRRGWLVESPKFSQMALDL